MATKLPSTTYLTNGGLFISKRSKSRYVPIHLADCVSHIALSVGKLLHFRLTLSPISLTFGFNKSRRAALYIRSSADGSRLNPTNDTNGGTRLIRAVQAFQVRLSARIKELRKNLPLKLFFFLAGFYCATAFATMIGQTGDWDVLSAAVTVAVVEGIGALMYKGSLPVVDYARNWIVIFNYWKAGLSLGLFLDSFKF